MNTMFLRKHHVISQRSWDYLTSCTFVHCFSNPSNSHNHVMIYLAVWLFVCLINALNVRIKDVLLWITHIAIIYSKATSSRFMAPSYFPLVHSKGTRAECFHARIFLISTNSDNPGLWALSVSPSLCLTSLPPHPWRVFHPSLNSVKGLLSITCTFIWGCAKSEMTDVEGRGLFWWRAEVAKIRENILPAFCLKCRLNMKNDATSAGFIFKLIIFVWTNLRLKTKSLQ